MMRSEIGWMALCLVMAGSAGCAEDTAPTASKGDFSANFGAKGDVDATPISEAGRFRPSTGVNSGDRVQDASDNFTNGALRAHRFYAWPGQKIEVSVKSDAFDTYVLIEGPALGTGDILAENDDVDGTNSGLSLTFEKGGAYRILVSSFDFLAGENGPEGDYSVSYKCLENCEMPEISLQEMIDEIRTEIGEEGVRQMLATSIPALIEDPQIAGLVQQQAQAALENGLPEAFPVLPMSVVSLAQGLLEFSTPSGEAPGAMKFDVQALKEKNCAPDRPGLKPVNEAIPGLLTGGWADLSYGDCALQNAQDFADVLNNLALENGSSVVNGDQTYSTIGEVIDALYASGHTIEVSNTRYFANFLGLWYKGRAVRAAAWLDTGIDIGNGETFALPSPHTHHNFHVRGPLINVDIMYYMGVSNGTSFRAVSDIRPLWSGGRDLVTYDSATGDAPKIKEIFELAGQLRKRWEAEGRGLPASGYGILGVCNDSTAVLELGIEEQVTIYPLVRQEPAAEDTSRLANLLRGLPNDLDDADPADAAERIRNTLPFDSLQDMPFPQLRETVSRLP
jgi:hypothetical protein